MLPSRFMQYVKKSANGCWHWTGSVFTQTGYGQCHTKPGRTTLAHRFAYEHVHGVIPRRGEPGHLQVDHACHNRSKSCAGGITCRHRLCVNPDHLIAKTAHDNTEDSEHTVAHKNRHKTHCSAGHEFNEANTYQPPGRLHRQCRPCKAKRDRERRARQ